LVTALPVAPVERAVDTPVMVPIEVVLAVAVLAPPTELANEEDVAFAATWLSLSDEPIAVPVAVAAPGVVPEPPVALAAAMAV
jgi:hypothetical protein